MWTTNVARMIVGLAMKRARGSCASAGTDVERLWSTRRITDTTLDLVNSSGPWSARKTIGKTIPATSEIEAAGLAQATTRKRAVEQSSRELHGDRARLIALPVSAGRSFHVLVRQ